MQKMEVFEDRKGFWLLLHEANRSCLWRKENGRQVGKTYLRSVWSQALEAQSSWPGPEETQRHPLEALSRKKCPIQMEMEWKFGKGRRSWRGPRKQVMVKGLCGWRRSRWSWWTLYRKAWITFRHVSADLWREQQWSVWCQKGKCDWDVLHCSESSHRQTSQIWRLAFVHLTKPTKHLSATLHLECWPPLPLPAKG